MESGEIPGGMRVLHFPPGSPLGWLLWRGHAPILAQGDVMIPDGAHVTLEVRGGRDLAPLASLPPDAFDRLVLFVPFERHDHNQELRHVARLTGLRTIDLKPLRSAGSYAVDAGLAHLAGLVGLQALYLGDTPVTDAGVAHLAGLTNLRRLHLRDTAVTDAGVAHLTPLIEMEDLDLSRTAITDVGVAHLAALTMLTRLNLSHTKVTDVGMSHLTGLTRLDALFLTDTVIGDAGMTHLFGLTKLHTLNLDGTAITNTGVARLMAAERDLGDRYFTLVARRTAVTSAGAREARFFVVG